MELISNGSLVRVDDGNKDDFILKKCHYIGYLSAQEQLQSMLEGFYKVIPQTYISVFTSDEVEAIICGTSFIDLEDWKANTLLKGYHMFSMTVHRFWKIMETYTQVELARIL